MSQLLSLSRAARLAGVSRGELQATIRERNIQTFEGEIAVEDLLKAYPAIDMEHDPVLERIASIKAAAKPKSRYSDHWLPEPEVLMARLEEFQHVLMRTKATLNNMEQLLAEVTESLEAVVGSDDQRVRETVVQLSGRLRQALQKAQTQTDRRAGIFARDAMLRFIAVSARILPSGHEFFVEGKDSLLDAALRAGLHLDYGCASGNCGACKVRVLKGKVRKIRAHDFVLSAREQEQGYCLACSNTAVSDVVIEASEALSAIDLPHQEIRCVLRKAEALSAGLNLVHVQTPRTHTLRFMAGQRVVMTLEDGKRRELAVASCPCDGRNLQFLLRRGVGDGFAETLLTGGHGQTLLIEGPQGDFLLEEEATEPAVFVAVGDGFAPIKSLVEHAIAIDNAASLHLFRVDDSPPGGQLDNLCRSWNDALDNFSYRRLAPDVGPAEAAQVIAEAFTDLARYRLYVAGPADFADDLVERLNALGVRAENTHADRIAVA
ncbi:MAG: 2Fe-2S iron-sulfur cluster-binding protein [Sedimenticolaceae bacterium]